MRHFTNRFALSILASFIAVALLAGCGGGDQPEEAARDVANGDVHAAPATAPQDDETIIRSFRLTLDAARAVVAVQERFHARVTTDPDLRARMDSFDESLDGRSPDLTTIAGLVWMVEQIPEMEQEVRAAGLSLQDFVLVSQSLTSLMAYDMGRQAGQSPDYFGLASEQNVALLDRNRSEFETMWRRLQEMAAEM